MSPSDCELHSNGARTATNCPSNYCCFFCVLQVFVGNADENTTVYNELNEPIVARYTRFQPTAWHDHISMRVELYGCKGTFLVTSFFVEFGKNTNKSLLNLSLLAAFTNFTGNINIYIYRHGVSWPLKKPIEEIYNSDTLTSAWLHRMPKIEKKEFVIYVVPMHCGDPLGKQQTITNTQK